MRKYEENIIYKQSIEAGQFVKKNKDGKIDDQDYYMFKLIFGTHQGQAGYLSYVDMNHDGMINTRDMIFVERCMGLQAGSFAYTPLVIR